MYLGLVHALRWIMEWNLVLCIALVVVHRDTYSALLGFLKYLFYEFNQFSCGEWPDWWFMLHAWAQYTSDRARMQTLNNCASSLVLLSLEYVVRIFIHCWYCLCIDQNKLGLAYEATFIVFTVTKGYPIFNYLSTTLLMPVLYYHRLSVFHGTILFQWSAVLCNSS